MIIQLDTSNLFILLEARLQSNMGFALRYVSELFTRSAITSPKVNRFGWTLEHSEYVVGSWPWQILGAIRAVATAEKPGKFLSCKQRTISPHDFGQISRNLTTRRSVSLWKLWKFYRKGSFSKKNSKISNILTYCSFRPPQLHNRRQFTNKITLLDF